MLSRNSIREEGTMSAAKRSTEQSGPGAVGGAGVRTGARRGRSAGRPGAGRIRRATVGLGLVALVAVGCGGSGPAPEPEPVADAVPEPPQFAVTGEHPCDPVGDVQFICDLVSPEDIAVVPGGEWAFVSGAREGGRLNLVNVADKTSTVLFPTPDSVQRLDAETYPDCPGGPFDLADPDASRLHGLYLDAGADGVHTLLVVHHGPREAVEFFEVDARDGPPSLAWVGCAEAPEGANLNSVVALPDGGFAATNAGIGVWEWQADAGWVVLPESEDTAPNGLEVSEDGQTLYIAGWAEEELTRLSRGVEPVRKDVVELGFRPDNLRMALDGSVIYAAGHTDRDGNSITDPREPTLETSNVAAIDPETLEFERIFTHPAMDGFISSTTGIRIGGELWLGSYRGDRLAYLPAPE